MNKKTLIWTLLVGLTTALSTALTYRLLEYAYRRTRHEEPPPIPRWGRLAMKPMQKGVDKAVLPG